MKIKPTTICPDPYIEALSEGAVRLYCACRGQRRATSRYGFHPIQDWDEAEIESLVERSSAFPAQCALLAWMFKGESVMRAAVQNAVQNAQKEDASGPPGSPFA